MSMHVPVCVLRKNLPWNVEETTPHQEQETEVHVEEGVEVVVTLQLPQGEEEGGRWQDSEAPPLPGQGTYTHLINTIHKQHPIP